MTISAKNIIPLIVACSLFMETLDSTIIATALPTIARSLDEDPLRLNLAITCYLLSLSIFIPLSGWMADKFGARTVFRAAIAVFMLGSIACGLSDTLWEFVVARMIQGMGGAMMSPVGRFVMLRSVEKSELMRAMIIVTTPAMRACQTTSLTANNMKFLLRNTARLILRHGRIRKKSIVKVITAA